VRKIAMDILDTPFDFNTDDSVLLDEDARVFSKTEKERYTELVSNFKVQGIGQVRTVI
jgi:hypothetical protein